MKLSFLFLTIIFSLLLSSIACANSSLTIYDIQNLNKIRIECIKQYRCNEEFIMEYAVRKKEEKKVFGEEMYNDVKKLEKELNKSIKKIVVPEFLDKNFDFKIRLREVDDIKISYIFKPQNQNYRISVKWDEDFKVEYSYKKSFNDILNIF